MTVVTETLQVSGIRCERCVMRLARTLEGTDGLEAANANLIGQVQLSYDDERISREALLELLARGGFREQVLF
jgi:copper chaperone CopZ